MRILVDVSDVIGDMKVHSELGERGTCPTGEPYVVICCGGIKEEGQRVPVICSTEELAIKYFKQSLKEYVESKPTGTLYWRWLPELHTREDGRYYAYCRLAISDKPMIEAASAT